MKRETNNKQARDQRPSLEQPDTGTAVAEKTRERLFNKLASTVCESTGTHIDDVGQRIICQVADALVWRAPEDEHERLINAMASIREMAPKNLVEAMLAVQMI